MRGHEGSPRRASAARFLPTSDRIKTRIRGALYAGPGAYDHPVQMPQLSKVASGLLDDVRTIARGMQVLPELAQILRSIETKVDTLNDEVHRMRVAVEEMGGDVKTVPTRLDELQHSLSPMRRIGRRFSRGEENGPG
jgi:hypothetical protein